MFQIDLVNIRNINVVKYNFVVIQNILYHIWVFEN